MRSRQHPLRQSTNFDYVVSTIHFHCRSARIQVCNPAEIAKTPTLRTRVDDIDCHTSEVFVRKDDAKVQQWYKQYLRHLGHS
jgi:hypothetical protein